MKIDHTLEIAAPAATVWSVITDLDRYPEWNPFVIACRSTLEPGRPIDMRVRVFPGFAQPQRETIFEHVPGRFLSYGVAPMPLGMLASTRSHEVTALGADRTRYDSRFELRGWLAPVVKALLGGRLAGGFAAMSAGIKTRAEMLSRATQR
ncbi:MAG: SRPBCC domain-containing protein [Candidatus Binatia bacterium]